MPSLSILAEPPVAMVDKVVLRRGTRDVATEYLKYLYSPEGQEIIARNYYRPIDRDRLERAFDDALLKSIRDATNGGYPLASEAFKARAVAPSGCRMERGRPGPRAADRIITTLTPN